MKNLFKLTICQMKVVDDKNSNITKALDMIETCTGKDADLVVLPEMFNCPYDTSKFREYAEKRDNSKTLRSISKVAKKYGLYIFAGSIPELDGNRLYNSSFIFNREGKIIGVHRKIHLFDVDIPGKVMFKESDILDAGAQVTVVDTEFCKVGVAICYDTRFPELLRLMTLKGAELMVIPGVFNMITGPAHWETLIRARAIDNQVYVAAASPARNEDASYVSYGHSMVVEPWGDVLVQAGVEEEIIYVDINLSRVDEVRGELPVLKNRRIDVYSVVER